MIEDEPPLVEEGGAQGKADSIFRNGPLYLNGAFDGSQRFSMWADTMEFARSIKRQFGKTLSWTYFINTCYFDRTVSGSAIGTARSRGEEIVRWAMAQQAINEGHEIADHAVRHKDGSHWTVAQWRSELKEFHRQVERNLFEPVRLSASRFVFPAWSALPGAAPGKLGAACLADADCDSGQCLAVSLDRSFCTKPCNSRKLCPSGMACGAPTWQDDTDVCVPLPELPVVYQGATLFDADGVANLDHPALKPYKIVGFRAPELGHNAALFDVLTELEYTYDTSQIRSMGPPQRTKYDGRTWAKLYQFPLMKGPGSLTVPMDYNYYVNQGSGDRMLSDYKKTIVDNYVNRDKQPWNIGHHFSLWNQGAYWTAMKGAFTFAAQGCPGSGGVKQCPNVEFPTFRRLAAILDGINGHADGIDIFLAPDAPVDDSVGPVFGDGVEGQ